MMLFLIAVAKEVVVVPPIAGSNIKEVAPTEMLLTVVAALAGKAVVL